MKKIKAKKAGVVALRYRAGRFEICLVSSRKSPKRLVLPKGNIDKMEKKRDAAMREAFEEAGLSGLVVKRPNVAVNTKGRPIEGRKAHIQYFPMMVDGEMLNWPEQRWRRRVWVSLNDIGKRRKYRHIGKIIDAMSLRESKKWRKFLRLVRGKKPRQ
ncbi:MAG: NUDIX hydrolase [Parvibaculales bacterium]